MRKSDLSRRGGAVNHRERRALALALTLALTIGAMVQTFSMTAQAVDLEKGCSLKIRPGSEEFTQDLTGGDGNHVVFDLYQIADAVEESGYDAYRFAVREDFAGLTLPEETDDQTWNVLAQEAARIALLEKGVEPVVRGLQPGEEAHLDSGELLSAGLYLIIARDAEAEDYVITVPAEETEGAAEDADPESAREQIFTVAHSEEYLYTFRPELVALPSKEAEDGVVSSANSGEWLYEMGISLKPSRELRLGSLEIVKTLLAHESLGGHGEREKATFVFSIEAMLDGERVYSDVAALTFSDAGSQSLLIEGIPVGAEVTVTEVYSGSSYELTAEGVRSAVIAADQVVSVSFENEYTWEDRSGSGIQNHFEYEEESGWSWTRQ